MADTCAREAVLAQPETALWLAMNHPGWSFALYRVAVSIVGVCWLVSVKEQVLKAIHRLPDDIDYRDVAEEVALLAAVAEAERDIEEGRVVSNAGMRARVEEWTAG